MVKSELTIKLDYLKAIDQATQLEAVARDLERLANNDFQGCLHNVSANWKGENARSYVRKGEKLKGDMLSSAKQLRRVATSIRNIARRTRDADLRARAIAMAAGGGGFR